MHIPTKALLCAAGAAGIAVALTACKPSDSQPNTEPKDITAFSRWQMDVLRADGQDYPSPLSVVGNARREYPGEGTYDGTQLLRAADQHVYGTPANATAADAANDGVATLNEIKAIVSHYDADSSGFLETPELTKFEEIGVAWFPGA